MALALYWKATSIVLDVHEKGIRKGHTGCMRRVLEGCWEATRNDIPRVSEGHWAGTGQVLDGYTNGIRRVLDGYWKGIR